MIRWALIFLLCSCQTAWGAGSLKDAAAPPGCTLVAAIPLKGDISKDARARKQIDSVIAELKKVGEGNLVRLEGHSRAGKTRLEYIKKSMNLAKEVEHYLRVDLDLELDLYVAAVDDKLPPANEQFVRIVVYPGDVQEEHGITSLVGR